MDVAGGVGAFGVNCINARLSVESQTILKEPEANTQFPEVT